MPIDKNGIASPRRKLSDVPFANPTAYAREQQQRTANE
jgi:hypothetical protein